MTPILSVGAAGQGVILPPQAGQDLSLDVGDQAGHLDDGVDPQMGLGAVSRHSLHPDSKTGQSLVGANHRQIGRLRHYHRLRFHRGRQAQGAAKEILLVHRAGKLNGAGGNLAGFLEAFHGVDHGHTAGLGVAGAASIEEAVPDMGLEGGNGHDSHRGGVQVTLEQEHPFRVPAFQGADQVASPRQDLPGFAAHAGLAEKFGDIFHHGRFAPLAAGQSGIDAFSGHHVLQRGQHLILAASPGSPHGSLSLCRSLARTTGSAQS